MMADARQDALRVVFFSYSASLIKHLEGVVDAGGHTLVGVVTTPGTRRRRSQDYLRIVERFGERCEVIVSSKPAHWADMIAPLKPDVIMCLGMPWRIPREALEVPRLGAINGHPSLLPKYRGAASNVFGWQFRNDERETGVTIHRMDGDFDTGAILVQERIPITDDDDFGSLGAKLDRVVPGAFQRALQAVASGEPGTPQRPGDGFYVDWFEESWRVIDWSQPARIIHNQARSWVGGDIHLGAVGRIDGKPVRVITTRLIDHDGDVAAPPGSVLGRDGDSIVIQCGDGPLRIVRWQEEDANPGA